MWGGWGWGSWFSGIVDGGVCFSGCLSEKNLEPRYQKKIRAPQKRVLTYTHYNKNNVQTLCSFLIMIGFPSRYLP